jgi:hypothetical protein
MNTVDYTGRTFGRVTVVGVTGTMVHSDKVYWNCICECGKSFVKASLYLLRRERNPDLAATSQCRNCSVRQRTERVQYGKDPYQLIGRTIRGWKIIAMELNGYMTCECVVCGSSQGLATQNIARKNVSLPCEICDEKRGIDGIISSTVYDHAEIAKFIGPLVYVIRKSNEYLYIGSSNYGLTRLFDTSHKHFNLLCEDSSSIEVYYCKSYAEAAALERHLISILNPVNNISTGYGSTRKIRDNRRCGTLTKYQYGCRCIACQSAAAKNRATRYA